MDERHISRITQELKIPNRSVQATAWLLEEGATIPFIARYRKEVTGNLDEVTLTTIRDRFQQLVVLDKRREAILSALNERSQLSDGLKEKLQTAETMAELEDIYLPYRPKRRTRATIAREKGLEPLAQLLFQQTEQNIEEWAKNYLNAENGIETVEEALAGARDIMAEWVNEDQEARQEIRSLFLFQGVFHSRVIKGKEIEGIKYKDYFSGEESVSQAPSHRILAMRRGEKELILSLRVAPPEATAMALLESRFVKENTSSSQQVRMAVNESYKRLLAPSMETEIRMITKEKADKTAIGIFGENLRQLLLAPPLGQKNVLAIDPGFRTGCKVVCLDRQGKLLQNQTIFPHSPQEKKEEATHLVQSLCERFSIEAVAVGNGTAGRETVSFLRSLDFLKNIPIVMVNESGASIYSASEIAREEFPDYDVTVRGAVSIGRRLMDPLAELVKIDPKSIGVGQYQHDVDQGELRKCLNDIVVSCVNNVGVEVNTASQELLSHVSGLGDRLAQSIIEYRNEHGPFRSREELKQVSRLGARAFEQSAGFLRIREGENPLDASAVHPESYSIVESMARDEQCQVIDLMKDKSWWKKIDLSRYVTKTIGLPTLHDIMQELAKPGRDPRQQLEVISFADGIEKMEDIKAGMILPGIVTNITAFGIFVDIGVHQDGLVHVSELSDRYVKNPANVVKVHQKVQVAVLAVDLDRKRISLTMKIHPGSVKPGEQELDKHLLA